MKKTNKLTITFRRYEVIIASSIVLSIVCVLGFVFLLPNFNRVQQVYREQKEFKKKITVLRSKNNILSSMDFAFYQENYPKVRQVLPERKDYVALFSTLDALEEKTQVTILRMDFQLGVVSTSSAKLKRFLETSAFMIPLTLEISGDIFSIKTFLESLDDLSGSLIKINSIRWETKGESYAQVVFDGQAFFYPPALTLASIDSPLPKLSEEEEKILDKITQIEIKAKVEKEEEFVIGKKNLFE